MHEQSTLEQVTFQREDLQAIKRVGEQALAVVTADFGTGYPHYRGGKRGGLAYHNAYHTNYVIRGGERMAAAFGLGREDRVVIKGAAGAHDVIHGHGKARGEMERQSGVWFADRLQGSEAQRAAAVAGNLAILGTEPVFKDGRLVGQAVSRLNFPSKRAEKIAMSVACADLGELFDPYGPYQAHRLWQEIKGRAPKEELPMDGIMGFQRNQVRLLNDYRFAHPTGEKVFGRLRGPAARHQEALLGQLEAGTITTGAELLAADLAFARKHS